RRAEFQKLVAGYLEGDLSPEEREQLRRLLEGDPALREEFLKEIQLHEAMKVVAQEAPEGARGERSEFVESVLSQWSRRAAPAPKGPPRVAAPRKSFLTPTLIAAGVLAGIAGLVFFLVPGRVPQEVAGQKRPGLSPKASTVPTPRPEETPRPREIPMPLPHPQETPPRAPESKPPKSVPEVAPQEKPEAPKPPDPNPLP